MNSQKNKKIDFQNKLNYLEYLKNFFNENPLETKIQTKIDKDFELQFSLNDFINLKIENN